MSSSADKPVRHILTISGDKAASYVHALDMLGLILTKYYPKPIVGGLCGASQGRGHVLQVAQKASEPRTGWVVK